MVPGVLTFLMTPSVVMAAAPKVGDPLAFYSVVATVIPVLFLALIYQAQLLERSPLDTPRRPRSKPRRVLDSPVFDEVLAGVFALYLLFITAVGEFVALHALSGQHTAGREGRDLIGISLYASALTLLFQRITLALDARQEQRGRPLPEKLTRVMVVSYLLLFALGLVLFAHP
jgi:hypothetical protein